MSVSNHLGGIYSPVRSKSPDPYIPTAPSYGSYFAAAAPSSPSFMNRPKTITLEELMLEMVNNDANMLERLKKHDPITNDALTTILKEQGITFEPSNLLSAKILKTLSELGCIQANARS
jgi:hypothetical protein